MEQTVKLTDIYELLKRIQNNMVTKHELDSAIETFAILSNEDTMRQIERSELDIKRGKVREFTSVDEI